MGGGGRASQRAAGGGGGGGKEGKARPPRWGPAAASMGVKRSPEVGDGGGDR